jgi:ribosomal protein S12 methylthiotransferase
LIIGLVALGCDKNTVDGEYLAGILADRGHTPVPADPLRPGDYDALVISTCGFIDEAADQSMNEIALWAQAKRRLGRPGRLIVAGCMAQRRAEEILEVFPEIDGVAGVGEFEALADLIEAADPRSEEVCLSLSKWPRVKIERPLRRHRLERAAHAHLKIADGCDHACAFCSIPLMKGPSCSVPPEMLLSEAKQLIGQGVREIDLIGQDLTLYGRDLGPGAPDLAALLGRLAALEGDFWLRLFYVYPGAVTNALLETMISSPKICRYLDVPLQHLNRDLLKAMKRPAGHIQGERLFARIRQAVPGITLRTTFLLGFPGETDAAFEELIEGVERMRIERLGAFVFSPQEGTAAYAMPNQVAPVIAAERFDRLMRLQQEIAFSLNEARVGRRERVLFDGPDPERGVFVARSQAEAPEIDGRILVPDVPEEQAGRFGYVEIERAEGYDLWGQG